MHDLGVGGYLHVHRLALHDLDALVAQEAGEEQFVHARRQRRAGGIDAGGVRADGHGDLHALLLAALALGVAEVRRAALVNLPVHADGLVVVDLHAIHADVALAGLRVFRVAHRQRQVAGRRPVAST